MIIIHLFWRITSDDNFEKHFYQLLNKRKLTEGQ